MKILVILEGRGGELARENVEVFDDTYDQDSAITEKVHDVIYSWVLAPGDTIRILED